MMASDQNCSMKSFRMPTLLRDEGMAPGEKILYVHQNPVKRGLVDSPELWKWSSAKGWLTGSETPISLDRNSVPVLSHLDDEIRSKLFE